MNRKNINKIIIFLICLFGIISCKNEKMLIEATKTIELTNYIEIGDFKIENLEEAISTYTVLHLNLDRGYDITFSEVKKNLKWEIKSSGRDNYIVYVNYKNILKYTIPITYIKRGIFEYELYFSNYEIMLEDNLGNTAFLSNLIPDLLNFSELIRKKNKKALTFLEYLK